MKDEEGDLEASSNGRASDTVSRKRIGPVQAPDDSVDPWGKTLTHVCWLALTLALINFLVVLSVAGWNWVK